MTDGAHLSALIQAGHPCLWIPTLDEGHALRLVREAAMGAGRAVRQWSAVQGITDGLVSGGPAESGTENPGAAMYRFAECGANTVLIACDLIGHLGDERNLRAARELILAIERCSEMGGLMGPLVIVDYRDDLPPVLRAAAVRFDISLPEEEEIERIALHTLKRQNKQSPVAVQVTRSGLKAMCANLRGLTRRQVEQVIVEVVAGDRAFTPGDLGSLLARKRQLIAADGLLEFVQAPAAMDEIGGLGNLREWLRRREKAVGEDAAAFGLTPPRGVLMLGVQGAGKSLCAKAIATAWRRPLLRLDPSILFDRYIGESERKLRDALRQAEVMAPMVLWIDEIEKGFASAASRSVDGGLSQRMFGTLLTWLQERRAPVFVAATANDIEALPPELLRKGRFDEIFFVDLPSGPARRDIFAIHLKKRGRDPRAFDLAALAAATDGYSGAEIESAIESGLHEAFALGREPDTPMLLAAVRASPPLSITMAERIAGLRRWAKGRCVPAE
ncbi:MAG: AAA family ATPase [Phycisphaerales bacterium]|nr:AAA family ATPase [Phycisphaerales bacterium]